MANDALIADIQRMRQEVVEARGACLNQLDTLRGTLEDAKDALRVAREHEQQTVHSDDEKKAEIKRLTDHVNGLPDKPQVFLERISKLESEQGQTAASRKRASETAHFRQGQVEQATSNSDGGRN